MYRIAVIGDSDSIYGFASLGIQIFPCVDPHEAANLLRHLAQEEYAVIYITEALASQIPQQIERYHSMMMPAVVPIPGVKGNTGIGLANVSKTVEQAVGSDILK
ncbi:MAG TPA: V-type ATP synthase subunit F [Ruminococcaceae bacterium]|nr:V-type ATP synthase subunit F [Oscillospiraceae bacterium]